MEKTRRPKKRNPLFSCSSLSFFSFFFLEQKETDLVTVETASRIISRFSRKCQEQQQLGKKEKKNAKKTRRDEKKRREKKRPLLNRKMFFFDFS